MRNTFLFARTIARRPSGERTTSSGVPPPPSTFGAVTFTTVRMSVPSYLIERSPSDPAQTYILSGSGPKFGAFRPCSVAPLPTQVMRVGSPPSEGSHTYSSSAVGLWLPKSSSMRMRCIFEPRTARIRDPSCVKLTLSKNAEVEVRRSGSPPFESTR